MHIVDVEIRDRGTILTFQLLTTDAQDWVAEHVPDIPGYLIASFSESTIQAFHADRRPGLAIIDGMREAGLVVE